MHTSFKIEDNLLKRVNDLLSGTETVSQFAYRATEEKVKRMESRDERARLQLAVKDKAILNPLIEDILRSHNII